MTRMLAATGVALLAIALAQPAEAQRRGSEVKAAPFTIKVVGLKSKTEEELAGRIKDFEEKAEFKIDARKGLVTVTVKDNEKLGLNRLIKAIKGDDKTFRVDPDAVKLIGSCAIFLEEGLVTARNRRDAMRTMQKVKGQKGVTSIRPDDGGTLRITCKSPGLALGALRKLLADGLKFKGDPITDVSFLGTTKKEGGGSGKKRPGSGGGDKDDDKDGGS